MRQEKIIKLYMPTNSPKAVSDRDGRTQVVGGGVIQTFPATVTVWRLPFHQSS